MKGVLKFLLLAATGMSSHSAVAQTRFFSMEFTGASMGGAQSLNAAFSRDNQLHLFLEGPNPLKLQRLILHGSVADLSPPGAYPIRSSITEDDKVHFMGTLTMGERSFNSLGGVFYVDEYSPARVKGRFVFEAEDHNKEKITVKGSFTALPKD